MSWRFIEQKHLDSWNHMILIPKLASFAGSALPSASIIKQNFEPIKDASNFEKTYQPQFNKFGEDSGDSCSLTSKYLVRQIDTSTHFSVFTVCEFPTISHPPDPYRHSASTHTHRWLSSSFGWLTIVWTTVKLSRRSWNSSRNHRNCLQFPEKISEKKTRNTYCISMRTNNYPPWN